MSLPTLRVFRALASAIVLTSVVSAPAEEVALPDTVNTCKHDTEDYTSCLRLAIQEAWPTFCKGISELELPALDPFVTPYYESVFENGPVKGNIVVKNSKTYGMQGANFLAVRPFRDGSRFRLQVDLEFPKLFVEGDYKMSGAIQDFQTGGRGYFNISMEGVKTTWDIDGRVEDDRWIVEHFKMLPEVTKMHVWFDDLFNGDEMLNTAARAFVNEYWPVLYRGMLPIVADEWDEEMTEFVNIVFSKLSFSKTFP